MFPKFKIKLKKRFQKGNSSVHSPKLITTLFDKTCLQYSANKVMLNTPCHGWIKLIGDPGGTEIVPGPPLTPVDPSHVPCCCVSTKYSASSRTPMVTSSLDPENNQRSHAEKSIRLSLRQFELI